MDNTKKNKKRRVGYYITLIILLIVLYYAYNHYQKNNFNDFIRSESKVYSSTFIRDEKNKYSKKSSYKIESPEFNDAMFYKEIKVSKNQSYRVSCMVKTKDVVGEKSNSGIGAQIVVEGTTERSTAVSGTSDWQKIELIFNSKNRDVVNIGFRLGRILGKSQGRSLVFGF